MSESYTALVTGGSRGLGAEICRHLSRAGYRVVSLSRRRAPEALAVESIEADLLDVAATQAAAAEIARRYAITHVIHSAGLIHVARLGDVAADHMAAMARIHLAAPTDLVQAVLPGMRARHFGRIILLASRAAVGMPARTGYGATKAGMIAMARTWALELARDGITSNVVAPGPTEGTDMFESAFPPGSAERQATYDKIPMGRPGRADEVARAVMFFSSPQNGYVTGQALYVCGGADLGLS
jgi:3-oxoacyl-[acyl-carrier protein] reductase